MLSFNIPPDDTTVVSHGLRGLTDVAGIARDRHKRLPVALSLTRDVLGFGLDWAARRDALEAFAPSIDVASVHKSLTQFGSRFPVPTTEPSVPDDLDEDKPSIKIAKRMDYAVLDKYLDSVREGHAGLVQLVRCDPLVSCLQTFAKAERKRKKKASAVASQQPEDVVTGASGIGMSRSLSDSQAKPVVASSRTLFGSSIPLGDDVGSSPILSPSLHPSGSVLSSLSDAAPGSSSVRDSMPQFSLDFAESDVTPLVHPPSSVLPPVAPGIVTSSEATLAALLEFGVIHHSLEHILLVVSLCMKESAVFTSPSASFSKGTSHLLHKCVPWLCQLLASLPRHGGDGDEDPLSLFTPKSVDDTTDQPGILALWLLTCLRAGAAAYLATQRDSSSLNAACNKPAPTDVFATFVAPSTVVLLLLRQLSAEVTSTLAHCSDGVACHLASTCLLSLVTVMQGVLHCIVYHGPRPDSAAKATAMRDLSDASGGASSMSRRSSPRRAGQSPLLQSSPAMLPTGDAFLSQSPFHTPYTGAFPPPLSLQSRSSSFEAGSFDFPVCNLNDVYVSLRNVLETTLFTLKQTIVVPRVSPAVAKAPSHPTATSLQSVTSATPRGVITVVSGEAGAESTAGIDAAARPVSEELDGFGAVVKPPKFKLHDSDDAADASSVDSDDGDLPHPLQHCPAFGSDLDTSAVLQSVVVASQRAWCAGLRVLYPTPVQRHVLLRCCLDVLSGSCMENEPLPPMFSPSASVDKHILSAVALSVVELFCAQDFAHTVLVSYIPLGSSIHDNERFGSAVWHKRDSDLLRTLVNLSSCATETAALFSSLLAAIQRSITRMWWRPTLEYPATPVGSSTGVDAGTEDSDGGRPSTISRRFTNTPLVASTQSPGLLTMATPSFSALTRPSANVFVTDAVSPFALGPAVPVQSVPFGLIDYDDNDDTPLLLDPARCAECISITGNGSQGRQIVDKTWGVVLSNVGFAPNTGTHAWDVKVRKCDRSYMSIGIATRETATSSHLGSDKFSWGMMGSKGLWYNRSKLKASYGKDLRTGMVVRVTYDSDNGTLTFGLHNSGGSSISSWGVAFKDLKGSGTLYPAVCLYNRNDEFSIKRVPAAQLSAKSSASVVLGTANTSTPDTTFLTTLVSTRLREASAAGCWHELSAQLPTLLVEYAVFVMQAAVSSLHTSPPAFACNVVGPLFHSLARIPPERFSLPSALILQPWISRLVESVTCLPLAVPSRPLVCDGSWELRSSLATANSSGTNGAVSATIQPQTYGATLQYCGDHPDMVAGQGKAANMAILGSVHGSWLRFTETWNGGSVCVITARVSSDGSSFYGFFTDSELRAQGTVVGDCLASNSPVNTALLMRAAVTEAFAVVNCAVNSGNAAADEASRIALASLYAQSSGGNGFRDAMTSSVMPTPQQQPPATIMDVSLEDFALMKQSTSLTESHLPRPLVEALLQPGRTDVTDTIANSMQYFLPSPDELGLLLSGKTSLPASPEPVITAVDVTMSSALDGGATESKDSDVSERENKDDDVAAAVSSDAILPTAVVEDAPVLSAGSSNGVIRPRKDALHVAEEWLASPLFAGGLRSDVARQLLLHTITAVTGTPCETTVDFLSPSSVFATDALMDAVNTLKLDEDVELPSVSAVRAFIDEGSPCDEAILSSAGVRNKVIKRLSPLLHAARRAVFAVMLHHTGLLPDLVSAIQRGSYDGFASLDAVKIASQHSQTVVLKLRDIALSAEFSPTIPVDVTDKGSFAAKECIRRCYLLLSLARSQASVETVAKWVQQFVTTRLECHEVCHAIRQVSLGVAAKSICRLVAARAVSCAAKLASIDCDTQNIAFGVSCSVSSLAKLAWAPKSSLKVPDSWLGRESIVMTGLSGAGPALLRELRGESWATLRRFVQNLKQTSDAGDPSHGATLLSLLGAVSVVLDFTKRSGFAEDAHELLLSGVFEALFGCVGWCVTVSSYQASVDSVGRAKVAPAVDVAHWPLVRNSAIAVLHGLLAQLAMFNGAEIVTLTTQLTQPSVRADYEAILNDPDRIKSPIPSDEPQSVTDGVAAALQACVGTYFRVLERCVAAFTHAPTSGTNGGDIRLNTPARNRVSLGAGQSNDSHIEFVQYAMFSSQPVFEGIAYGLLSSLATCAHGKLLQTTLVDSSAPSVLLQLVLCAGVSRRVQKHCLKVLRAVLPAVNPDALHDVSVSFPSPINATVNTPDAIDAAFALDRLGWKYDSDGDVCIPAVGSLSTTPAQDFVTKLLDIVAATHPDVSSVGMRASSEGLDEGEDGDNVAVEVGDAEEQPSGPAAGPPEEDEEFLLAQALALSMGEEFPHAQPQPASSPPPQPEALPDTRVPVGDAALIHGQFLKHTVVLASFAANRTLGALRVFGTNAASPPQDQRRSQPGLVIDSALANSAVSLLRQLMASSSWQSVLAPVFVSASSEANAVLKGEFESLSDPVAKAVLSRHVGCDSSQGESGHAVGKLGYESCETLDVLCHWTDKVKMDPVHKVLARGWAVLNVLGGSVSHVRLGGAVRKRDGLPWMQPPDENSSGQGGSGPGKHKTASQLAPKPSDYDVSIGPAVTVIIQAQGIVKFEASKSGQTLVSLSGNGVGLCGAAPGLTYADEIGVDVFTDLAPRGSDVGIVVGLVGPAAAQLHMKTADPELGSDIPRGLAAIAKAQKGEPHVEVAVKGSVGAAYVVRVGYEDVVAFEEIPVPSTSQLCRQFVANTLRQMLPSLFATIFEEEACGLDATDPSNQPTGRKRSLRSKVTIESPKERDLPIPDSVDALGRADVTSPDWLCADGSVDETVFDIRLARACNRVAALKSTNTLLLQHPGVITEFVSDVVSCVDSNPHDSSVSLWSFKQLLARAGCLTQSSGLADVGEVEAVFALLLEGLRMQCSRADTRTLDQLCAIMEHVATVGLESPSDALQFGKVIAHAPARTPSELAKVLRTVAKALKRLRDAAVSPVETSDDTDGDEVAANYREGSPFMTQLHEELEPVVSFGDTASVGSPPEAETAPVAPPPAVAPGSNDPSPECSMMMDMGFPREWAEYALQRTGDDMQQSLNFLFEHEGDMDRLLAEAAMAASVRAARQQAARTAQASVANSEVGRHLVGMGFPPSFAAQAISAVSGPLEATLAWVVQHPDVLITSIQSETGSAPSPGQISSLMGRAAASVIGGGGGVSGPAGERSLSSMLGGLFGARPGVPPTLTRDPVARPDTESGLEGLLRELGSAPSDDGPRPRFPPPRSSIRSGSQRDIPDTSSDPTMTQDAKDARKASVQLPDAFGARSLQSVAGTSVISDTLEVEGTHAQSFRSVGAKQLLLTRGKWYYEVFLNSSGVIQLGWADGAFKGDAVKGEGVGDDLHSWAYDGARRYIWHQSQTSWGAEWRVGDVIGCSIDIDKREMAFSRNGSFEPPMGTSFVGFEFSRGLYPCASLSSGESVTFNFGGPVGGRQFCYPIPSGYRPIYEAFAEFPAPKLGLPRYCLGSITEDALGDIEDHLEAVSTVETSEFQQMISAGGLMMSMAGNGSVTQIVESRYFGPNGGGRGFVGHGWGGNTDNFPDGVVSEPRSDVQPSKFTLIDTPIDTTAQLIAMIMAATTQDLRQYILFTAHTLSILYSRSIVASMFSVGGQQLLTRSALLAQPMFTSDDDTDSADDGNTVFSAFLRVMKLLSWKGFGFPQRNCNQLLKLSLNAGNISNASLTASHVIQLFEPGLRAGMLQQYTAWLAGNKALSLTMTASRLMTESCADDVPPTLRSLVKLLEANVTAAALPALSKVVWRPSDSDGLPEVAAGLVSLTENTFWCDADAQSLPNVLFASWLSSLLMELATLCRDHPVPSPGTVVVDSLPHMPRCSPRVSGVLHHTLAVSVLNTWVIALRSANMALKEIAARVVAGILREAIEDVRVVSVAIANGGATSHLLSAQQWRVDMLTVYLHTMDPLRIHQLTVNRMETERKQGAVKSLYLQAITDLDAIVQTAVQLVSPAPSNDGLDTAIAEGLLAAIADITALGDGVPAPAAASESKFDGEEGESKEDGEGAVTPRAQLTLSAAIDQLKSAGLSRGKPWSLLAVGGGFGPEIDVVGDMECVSFSGTSSMQPFAGKDASQLMCDNVFGMRSPSQSPSNVSTASSAVSVGPLSRIIRIGQTPREGNEDPLLHPGVAFRLQLFDESDPVRVNVCGIVDLPDFRSSVAVSGFWLPVQPGTPSVSGVLLLMEREIVYGNAGIGWKTRYGHNYWAPGSVYVLTCDKPIAANGIVAWPNKLSGTTVIFNYSGEIVMTGDVTAQTSRLFAFDPLYKHRKIDVSGDGQTAVMNSSTDRALVLGSVGFSKGVHYWEVHVGAADHGGVFIGVCPKPAKDPQDVSSVTSRWSGWGFVNFRATVHKSTEKVYGEFFNAGDIIGVKLDMDQGTISFFLDGLRFGEHVLADMGVAYEKLADQSFSDKVNVVLYPCVGFKKRNDKVSLTGKYVSLPGYTSESLAAEANLLSTLLPEWGSPLGQARSEATMDVAELLTRAVSAAVSARHGAPIDHYSSVVNAAMTQFATGAYQRYTRWSSCRYTRVKSRAGIFVDLDSSVAAFDRIGSTFRAQQRVKIRHHWTDQTMDVPEEAVVLGVYNGCVWYRVKKAGGSEGSDTAASLAWYWLPQELPLLEVVDTPAKPQASDAIRDQQLSREQFFSCAGLAGPSHHSTDTDRMLVALVNSACDVSSVDPVNLRPDTLLKHAELAKSSGIWKGSDPIFKWDSSTLLSRFCVLLHLNQMLGRVLPYLSLSPRDAVGFTGAGCGNVIRQQRQRSNDSGIALQDLFAGGGRWHASSLGAFVRTHRNVMFTATKLSFWNAVVTATTTPTPLSQDEYEEPREIRLVKINRGPRTSKQALTNIPNVNARVKRSVFGQLYAEVKTWNMLDNSLRRSFLGKGHGGQRRAFKVKFVGEGVNDYGGPYRAVFEQIVDELQAEVSPTQCVLPFFSPSAKRASGVTDPLQGGVFDLNTADVTLDAHMLDYLSFFGRVLGVAVRHGMQLGLALPRWFWRVLVGAPLTPDEIAAINVLPEKQLSAVLMGLASILPLELFQLFDSAELETLFCGTDDVSVDFLRSVTEYEGVAPTDPHITMFWEVLSEFTPGERSQFLRFVWARSRLPSSAAYLPTPFKLQDLRDKLLYAIQHSPNMDADVRLSNAEGWADA